MAKASGTPMILPGYTRKGTQVCIPQGGGHFGCEWLKLAEPNITCLVGAGKDTR